MKFQAKECMSLLLIVEFIGSFAFPRKGARYAAFLINWKRTTQCYVDTGILC